MLDNKSLNRLDHYSNYNPRPLSIQELMQFGKSATETESYLFLRQEIPVRLANIMKEMNFLPGKLLRMPSVNVLQDWYAQCFRDICSYEDRHPTSSTLAEFCQTLKTAHNRHVNVVQTMAQGVLELKECYPVDQNTDVAIQYFLDRFYMSRISTRMLLNQHSFLFGPDADRDNARVGMIDPNCNVLSVMMEAFHHAGDLCQDYYNIAPDIDVKVHNEENKSVQLVYPPSHLYHIMFELFKNSMRAVVETHKSSASLPDLEVRVAKGEYDVSIRVSDKGGGIPRHITDQLFQYLFSTAPRPSMTPDKAPLAGYGFGLPLSRQYARYFHGDLILYSYDGYGTDAVVYLKTLTHEAKELLPIFNKASTKQYKTPIPTSDWTGSAASTGGGYPSSVSILGKTKAISI